MTSGAVDRFITGDYVRPPRQLQQRAASSYTSLIIQAVLNSVNASGAMSGALEIAAGTVSRSFAASQVTGRDSYMLDAMTLSCIGRDLIECGEIALLINPGSHLIPLPHIDIAADSRFAYTAYDGSREVTDQVVWVKYSEDRYTRRGIGPMGRPTALRDLANLLERQLSLEAGSVVGHIIPSPTDGNDPTFEKLKEDLKQLDGGHQFVKSMRDAFGQGSGAAPSGDWKPQRLGMNVPAANVSLYDDVQSVVLAACGIPVSVVAGGEGSAARADFSRYIANTVEPLARLTEAAASRAGLNIQLDFTSLVRAADMQGRSRSVGSLVKQAGVDQDEAMQIMGLRRRGR